MTETQRPSVRMSDDEAWQMVERSVNGTLTTLKRDGRPVALPVWFVALDRRIYITTRGRKLQRIRRDSRCSFLVEAGERWADLRAVHLECHGQVIEPDDELQERITSAMDAKYRTLRTDRASMPSATRDHYRSAPGGIIELRVDGKVLTWDNRKLGTG
jgi:nitroimidazol reductase NimA-like FMN-containing flavoprotein (pyridoxamine 5'-phosphate oxidase superfamily)